MKRSTTQSTLRIALVTGIVAAALTMGVAPAMAAGSDDAPGSVSTSGTHDLNDDHGIDGPGHDLNDDHGIDGPGHDLNDDHGVHVVAPATPVAPVAAAIVPAVASLSSDDDIDGDGLSDDSITELDIDGDGRLNASDRNLDGDSKANKVDKDMDGDGIRNTSDDTPRGTL
jgi:hypothetical protein